MATTFGRPEADEAAAAATTPARDGAGAVVKRGLAAVRRRLSEHTNRLDAQRARLDQHEVRLNRQLKRLDTFQKRIDEWSYAASRSRVEYVTSVHQFDAIEQRIAALEDALANPITAGDAEERAEARGIVDAVRAEHARVRSRLTMIAAYEERLRRVEQALLHAIALERMPRPAQDHVGSEIIAARETGLIAPDATELPSAADQRPNR